MKYIKSVLSKIASWFSSPKVKKVFDDVLVMVQMATPIVAEIAAITPNKTDDEVIAAYQKYGVPLATVVQAGDQTAIGNALLNLATTLLQKKLSSENATAATNILNTAVQIAVTALKAS